MSLPLLLLFACAQPAPSEITDWSSRRPITGEGHVAEPFAPLPTELALSPAQVALGERLFQEPLLSGQGDRACVDCHDLATGGVVPGEARSNHPISPTGPYNVPTVFNVGLNFLLNWQGAFSSLEDHVSGAMMNARVMDAGSYAALQERLGPSYDEAFRAAGYPEGVSRRGVEEALAEYERSLITPDSPFDRSLRGEAELSPEAARGYQHFVDMGCASCHQGINLGGNLFQRFGVFEDAFGRPVVQMDYGRALLTQDPSDEHVFRVPSLRNVAVTAPYFHDGSAATLDEAVQRMARVQLGVALDEDEREALVAFLESLTGEYQGFPLQAAAVGP